VKDYLIERGITTTKVENLPNEYRRKLQTMLNIQGRFVERENPISVVPNAVVSLGRNKRGGFNIILTVPSGKEKFAWLNIR